MKFSPIRLSIARKRRLLNKKGFADKLGVAQHTVGRWERGDCEPTAENVRIFSDVLGFSSAFFYGEECDEAETASFRKLSTVTAVERDGALAAGAIAFLISDWIEARFDLPSVELPDLSGLEPDAAARVLRQEWQLGEKPISNVLRLLESKGARVFSLAENASEIDAYAIWRKGNPYVFLNLNKSAERSRFDAAHELGHLVLHQDGGFTGREAEDQANAFASSFLLPRGGVVAGTPHLIHLQSLMQMKQAWGVSLSAMTYRMHKLGLISDWKYRDLFIEISRQGWRRSEPLPMKREKSLLWEKVLRILWSERVSIEKIAADLSVPLSEINDLVIGLISNSGGTDPDAQGQYATLQKQYKLGS